MIYKIDTSPEKMDIDAILRDVAKLWDNPKTPKITVDSEFRRTTALLRETDFDDCAGE